VVDADALNKQPIMADPSPFRRRTKIRMDINGYLAGATFLHDA